MFDFIHKHSIINNRLYFPHSIKHNWGFKYEILRKVGIKSDNFDK